MSGLLPDYKGWIPGSTTANGLIRMWPHTRFQFKSLFHLGSYTVVLAKKIEAINPSDPVDRKVTRENSDLVCRSITSFVVYDQRIEQGETI